MSQATNEFEQLSIGILGKLLDNYGYEYQQAYYRPVGTAVEFAKGEHRLFVVCEGNVVNIDLILHIEGKDFYRVDLNQALWFNGIRSITKTSSVSEQLSLFASELEGCCRELLTGSPPELDRRYSYPMSHSSHEQYLMFQRGKE